jgi:putative NADH-flavin reductase
MKIALLGSTGFVGTVLLKKALAQGHQLKVLVRSPEKLGDAKAKVEVARGDVLDPAALETLVQNVDAVISVASPPMKEKFDVEKYARATQNLISAMKRAKVNRLITITGAAAEVAGKKRGFKPALMRFLLGMLAPDAMKLKDMELTAIAASGLNWTVIRPPTIGSGKPTGNVAASESDLTGMSIDVEDISDFILSLLKTNAWDRKAPIVSSKK